MENNFRTRQRKSLTLMRTVYGVAISLLILSVGIVVFFGSKWNLPFSSALSELDPLMRYLFGGLCILYGSFRMYRSVKKEY